MVRNNTNINSILLEVFASVFTVSSYFPDNPHILYILNFSENMYEGCSEIIETVLFFY